MIERAPSNLLHCFTMGSFSTTGGGETEGGLAGAVGGEVDVNRVLFPPFFLEKNRLVRRNILETLKIFC